MKRVNIDLVVDNGDLCGEAPIWDRAKKRLLWADIPRNRVCEYLPASGVTREISSTVPVSGLALNATGELVLAGGEGLYLLAESGRAHCLLQEHAGEKLVFNDILAAPNGGLYAGTIYWGATAMERTGKLYLINPDLRVEVMDEGIELSNGLALSPDQRTLYYVDSTRRMIFAYEVEEGTARLRNRREVRKFRREDGLPDGITTDAEGFIWCAFWYGGRVIRIDPEGNAEGRIDLPVKQVSSVGFGGMELEELYITTASDPFISDFMPAGMDLQKCPLGGGLYRLRPEVQGKPEEVCRFQAGG